MTPRWNATSRALVIPVLLVLVAEIAFRSTDIGSDALAAPSAVMAALLSALGNGTLLAATRDTLLAAFGGLALGGTIGLLAGILFGLVRPVDHLMETTVEIVRPIPSVALIPIAMLVFGFGYRMEIAIVAFSCVWPMLILTRAAIAGVNRRLFEVAAALRLSALDRVTKIVLPAALPRVMVALRLSTGIALVVAVTVEIAANPLGLGYAILIAQQSLNPALMLAILVWLGILGFALNVLLVRIERVLVPAPIAEGRQ